MSLFRLLGRSLAAVAVLVACSKGTGSDDVGGVSHFACESDADCAAKGPGLVCVARECKAAPDAQMAQGTGGSATDGAATGGVGAGGVTGTGGGTIGPLTEPILPPTPSDCPTLVTGLSAITVLGQTVSLWVGAKRTDVQGPVMFYWHGTGGRLDEAGLLGPALQEIQDLGGIVASFDTSTKTGEQTATTGDFYTGDFDMADYIVGCAIQQLNIDTKRIFTAGCGGGGLQAGGMVFARSNYLAGAMPNSGGNLVITQFQNPSHIPSLITTHGSCTSDVVFLNFADESRHLCNAVSAAGGIVVDCEHSGTVCGAPAEYIAAQWQFLKDHPFGVNPDPYAGGLPASFPSGCVQYPLDPPPADCP